MNETSNILCTCNVGVEGKEKKHCGNEKFVKVCSGNRLKRAHCIKA